MTGARFDITEAPPLTRWNFLSLGAGVQSSTLALMAAHGEVEPRLDAAIFADTGAEPRAVYEWLTWLECEIMASPSPFPVYRVSAGSLRQTALTMRMTADGRAYSKADIPAFTLGVDGSRGMVSGRRCTMDFKIAPLLKKTRALAGIRHKQAEVTVTTWMGISWDELQRMREPRNRWLQHRWPLIERRMRRQDCLNWMKAHGYPAPPRSACEFCPFHSDAEWRNLQLGDPEAFARAVQFELDLQRIKSESANFRSTPYLHSSRRPLSEVDFTTDRGQLALDLGQDWNVECEGMCGV